MTGSRRLATAVALVIACVLLVPFGNPAQAGTIYVEPFNFDTGDADAGYEAFSFFDSGGTGSAVVTGGALVMDATTNTTQQFLRAGFAMPFTATTRVGASNSNGNYNVGLVIGNNNVVFHPGFGGGALRVEGPGGFGNTNVGFTPANSVFHKLEVTSDGTGQFDLKLTDGANPANVFTASYNNPTAVGGNVGLRRSGGPTGNGQFDILDVSVPGIVLYADTFPGDFHLASSEDISGVDGRLVLRNQQTLLRDGPSGAYTLNADVTADASNGSYNVGLQIGQNNLVFHPGLGGGAFRVEGTGGFGNTNMGFTPANNVLHHMEVVADGTGNFDITVTDGANPANVFNTSFTNAGSVGGDVGLRRSGPTAGVGIYDNLVVLPDTPASGDRTLNLFDSPFSTTLNGGSAEVLNGILRLGPAGGGGDQEWNIGSFGGSYKVSVEVGEETSSPGNFNVGLRIGENNIIFHPGLSGGALRVDGPGGFGNTDVGFTPAAGTLHLLEVTAFQGGWFDLTLVDRANPANVFSTSFFNPGSVGGDVALRRSGPALGVGLFDNVVVQFIPEPGSLVLLVLGALGILVVGRRRKR